MLYVTHGTAGDGDDRQVNEACCGNTAGLPLYFHQEIIKVMKPSLFAKVIFDRQWISFIYFLITLLTSVQAIFKSSFAVGATALVASALCYFSVATFVGSVRARRDKKYNLKELTGIAAIALVLFAAGIALMAWSGFWLGLFGVPLKGTIWCFVGLLVAVFTTKREHAL